MITIKCEKCGNVTKIGAAEQIAAEFGGQDVTVIEGMEVPKEYWDLKNSNSLKGSIYQGWWVHKVDNKWLFKRPDR